MDDQAAVDGEAGLDLVELSVVGLQADLAAGRITAERLMHETLAHIARWDPAYNAFVHMNPAALDEARAVDAARAAGEPLGPLAGAPLAVKDSVDVAGMPTTCGWAPLSPRSGGYALIPSRDAAVVARLRRAGAIVVGKTNVPAFSASTRADSSWAGRTYNAVDRGLMPGGSSTGTATAVAAGFALLGVAEETGGSIQIPASAQSLVSVKPTFGLAPNTGLAPCAASTRDVIGPQARTVADAAMMLEVMAGYALEDPKTFAGFGRTGGYVSGLRRDALKGARLGLYGPGWGGKALTSAAADAYGRACGELEAAGAVLIPDPLAGTPFASHAGGRDPDLRGMECLVQDFDAYLRADPASGVRSMAELVQRVGVDPFAEGQPLYFLRWLHKAPLTADGAPDISSFLEARAGYLAEFDGAMARHRLDGMVLPQAYAPVPPLEGDDQFPATACQVMNIAGVPGVTVPAGRMPGGSPFSLIFIGPLWSEARLLALAYGYEGAFPGRLRAVLSRD